MTSRLLLALALLMNLAIPAQATDAPRDELITFRVKDQFDALHTDARYRRIPLLALWGDRTGSAFMNDWNSILCDSLVGELCGYRLRTVQVAHVKGAPFFVKGKVKGVIRDRGKAPVLMDWGGEFRKAYACREDHCNLLLFDRESQLVATWTVTGVDAALLAEILAAVRGVVAQRRTPSR